MGERPGGLAADKTRFGPATSPRRVAVVLNPAAGGGDPASRRQDTRRALAGAGLELVWLETTEQDPGVGLTRRAVAEGVDLVMAQGGDGTVRACVTGLAGTEVPLAVLPGGTGNLLAVNFDIPTDLDGAVEVGCGAAARTRSWRCSGPARSRSAATGPSPSSGTASPPPRPTISSSTSSPTP